MSDPRILAYDHQVIWLEAVGCDRDGKPVLDGITMGLARGELIVIEGPIGSGKSTLLEVAGARRLPDRGTLWFAGRNILALQRASLPFVRRNIGYAAADSPLWVDATALANVVLALAVRGESPAAAEAAARVALTLIAADELALRPVSSLSSGQRGLVGLARAIAGTPPVVIVDEPVSGADLGSGRASAIAIGGQISTPIGPLHVDWGHTEQGRERIDLLLGERF